MINHEMRIRSQWGVRAIERRGSTLILVLWTVGICTLIVLSLQVSAFRQSSAGAESIGRVRAKWAARAGVEECIAYLAWETEHAADSDPVRLWNALADLSDGELAGATWEIRHDEGGKMVEGPLDVHSKLNVNLMTEEQLMLLDGMTPDVARSILDWIDTNDEPMENGGTESQYYEKLNPPYEARNGSVRSLQELELVFGVEPELLRGEDWNLNGILDENENDGDLTWPPDNADDYLDSGWSGFITAVSKGPGFGQSGEPKLMLATADLSEIEDRMGVDADQAQALKDYASRGGNTLEALITSPLSQIAASNNGNNAGGNGDSGNNNSGGNTNNNNTNNGGGNQPEVADLSDSQLRAVLDEGLVGGISRNVPGKVNVNTAPREVLEMIPGVGPTLADQIMFTRTTSARGFTNLLDLMNVPGMTQEELVTIAPFVDVRSSVFVITSKGRATTGRAEVELVVTIDRSELPIRIIDYLER